MAENIRTTPLRLNASEHRAILFFGDLLTGVLSVFAAIETWRRYNYSVILSELVAEGVNLIRAEQQAQLRANIEVPFWFYLLPIIKICDLTIHQSFCQA